MNAAARAATLVALAVAARGGGGGGAPPPAAGEAEPEAWIEKWHPQYIDTDGDGAIDGFNVSLTLNTTAESANVSVELVVHHDGAPYANVSRNLTLHRNATTGWGWPAGYWVALEWNASENGSYSFETILYNESGGRLDNRSHNSSVMLIAPGEGRLAFEYSIDDYELSISVRPNHETNATTNLTLNNIGNTNIIFSLRPLADGVVVYPLTNTTVLRPGESCIQQFTAGAFTGSRARTVNVTIEIQGRDSYTGTVSINRTVNLTVTIEPYFGLSIRTDMCFCQLHFGGEFPIQYTLANKGNIDYYINISVANYDDLISKGFQLPSSIEPIYLPMGHEIPFTVTIKIPNSYTEFDMYFTVRVRANASYENLSYSADMAGTYWARNAPLFERACILGIFTTVIIVWAVYRSGIFNPPARSAMRRLQGRLRRTVAAARGRWRTRRRRGVRGPRSEKPPPP